MNAFSPNCEEQKPRVEVLTAVFILDVLNREHLPLMSIYYSSRDLNYRDSILNSALSLWILWLMPSVLLLRVMVTGINTHLLNQDEFHSES